MSIYNTAGGNAELMSPDGKGFVGRCAQVKEGCSSVEAFKKSPPAQCALVWGALIGCAVFWACFTDSGEHEMAELGVTHESPRDILADACKVKQDEYGALHFGKAAEYKKGPCQCVRDLDALVRTSGGRKTKLEIVGGQQHQAGDPIQVSFSGASDEKDWIAIYHEGHVPAADGSHKWSYHKGDSTGSGIVTLTPDTAGQFYVTMFCCNGYVELSPRVPLTITPRPMTAKVSPAQSTVSSAFYTNTAIEVRFQGAVDSKDWIGLYEAGTTPGEKTTYAHSWAYHKTTPEQGGQGSVPVTPTKPGNYYLAMFCCDGYVETSVRVPIKVICAQDTVPCQAKTEGCYSKCMQ